MKNKKSLANGTGGRYSGEMVGVRGEHAPPPSGLSTSPFYKNVLGAALGALLAYLALNTSLVQQVLEVWEVCGNFFQQQYHHITYFCNNDPFNLYVWGITVVDYVFFWGFGSLYLLMDLTGRPAFIRKYKVQPGTNEPLTYTALFKLVAVVNFNQLAIQLPLMWGSYYLMEARGADFSPRLPSIFTILVHFVIFSLFDEVVFYYSHRLFHHRLLYRHIHKIHHTWQSPVSVSASYAHPIEHLVSNTLPHFTGPLVLGAHPFTIWLWFALGNIYTLAHHSGYHLPFLPSPQFHDYHHLKFNECYGSLGILDQYHGTDRKYRKSINSLKHGVYYSLSPPTVDPTQLKKLT